ncbi:hypothetical protein [Neptuniibacter sp. QD37_11]|uniref:hypothetical protein n=1 Tax=Neptuniibacter sp. QD37_11 TaxID=3398209 RepID=UPI0039F52375
MDTEIYNSTLKELVSNAAARQWLNASDRKAYCYDLLATKLTNEHELVCDILRQTLCSLLKKRADDALRPFNNGDGVSILCTGVTVPATVTHVYQDSVVVQLDIVSNDGATFTPNPYGDEITFTRLRENVFISCRGLTMSRLLHGKVYRDVSTKKIEGKLTARAT